MSMSPLISRAWTSGSCWIWKTGAIFVAAGMLAGAFGAHGLRRNPDMSQESLQAWGSASSFAVYNGLGLLLVSLHPQLSKHRFAGPAIASGGVLFSTSIMALVLDRERFKIFGPITPLGGMVMIAGYVALAL